MRKLTLVFLAFLLVASAVSTQMLRGGVMKGGGFFFTPARSVLVVIIDDFGTDRDPNYGATGDWIPASHPGFDRLAAEGIRFTNAFANPICAPTRSSLMQGAFNASDDGGTGVYEANGTFQWDADRESHIGNLLRSTVETSAWGKMQTAGQQTAFKFGATHIGFDTFVGQIGQGTIDHWIWLRTETTRAEYEIEEPLFTNDPAITDVSTDAYFDDYIVTRALAHYGARDRSKQYFSWIALYEPHLDNTTNMRHDPTVPYSDEAYCTPLGAYNCQAAMGASVDVSIVRILESVDLESTCVIVLGDNGSAGGAYGTPTGGKALLTESGIRVPLYMVGCGITPGTVTDQVHAADIWATILDMHGITSYAGADAVDGYSFRSLIGESCGFVGRCWTDRPADRGIVIARGNTGTEERAYFSRAHPDYKLIRHYGSGAVSLRNVSAYTAGGAEPTDLCGGDGDCTGITGADATAYTEMCIGLDNDDNPGGVSCAALGGGGASACEGLCNDPTLNVFDTYDDNCDGSDSSIKFCEGAEDGSWFPDAAGESCGSGCDYYSRAAGNTLPDPAEGSVTGAADYTMCNAGTIDENVADFGACGTPCTLTKGWIDRAAESQGEGTIQGFHTLMLNGTTAGSFHSTGTDHWSLRFYVKFAGATTARCGTDPAPTGSATCSPPPAFVLRGSNGYKGMVFQNITSYSGGLGLQEWDTWGGGSYGSNPESPDQNFNLNYGWNDGSPFTTEGATLCDNPPGGSCWVRDSDNYAGIDSTAYEVDWRDPTYADHWWYVELTQHAVDTTGYLEIRMRPCGKDGLDCAPTDDPDDYIIAQRTGLDLDYDGSIGAGSPDVRSLWINFWGRGQTGEMQIDEIVFRDRNVLDENIGFCLRRGIDYGT